MKPLSLFILLFIYSSYCLAQKPALDASVFDKWPSVQTPSISNNGNYALYTIFNQPVGSSTLVIQSTRSTWKMEIPGGTAGVITEDSKKVVFIKPQDSLCILTLGSTAVEQIPHISSFRLFKQGAGQGLAYNTHTPQNELVLRNLITGSQRSFPGATEYLLSNDGYTLLLKNRSFNGSSRSTSLNWVNLINGNTITIWQGFTASNFVFDADNIQLAFIAFTMVNKQPKAAVWHYKAGDAAASMLATEQSAGMDSSLSFDQIWFFNKKGNSIFLSLKEKESPSPDPNAVRVDIWSYNDPQLQSQQLAQLDPGRFFMGGELRSYRAVINIYDHHVIRLQQEDERMEPLKLLMNRNPDDFSLLMHMKGDECEQNWNRASHPVYYIVSTKDGERKQILNMSGLVLSPGGKYAVGTDTTSGDFYSYELATKLTHNITRKIPIPLIDNEYDLPDCKPQRLKVAAWLANDTALLIYGDYDIWQVDPAGRRLPVNITNGYGRRHNIVFRLAMSPRGKPIPNSQQLILTAFNRVNKKNGFYSLQLNKEKDPEPLTMEAYTYDVFGDNPDLPNVTLLKARDAESYIVQRMSAAASPNYFFTSDFKTFTPLSSVYPEKWYNWLTSELITWKTLDGKSAQGILYKPEDVDPKKKYPIIFYCNESMSDYLNVYKNPKPSSGSINIPWFVSHGYMVFTPDIQYTIGEPGQSAYNSIVAAAKYLTSFSWVDTARMGIHGYGFGGYATNYLITYTNIFAAASITSATTNFISSYGSIIRNDISNMSAYESGEYQIGATLWQKPELYIKNSPIFRVDKVTTPLLMMHNKKDVSVPFAQGIELFTALRRLGKKAWMLQYDDSGTGAFGEDGIDYTIRITQFFDHYLKNTLPPKWMTVGIPAKLKGIDSGLEPDTFGGKP